jgi:hypothetical protein
MSLGDIIGGTASGIGAVQQGAAAQTAANSQAAVNNQDMQALQTLLNQYNQSYSPALGPTSSALTSAAGGAGSQENSLASMFQQAGINPAMLSQITGINADQLTQALTQYASNPSGTSFGQIGAGDVNTLNNTGGTNLAAATPGLSAFYSNEQQNGINPQFAQNAQDQLQQGYNQAIANTAANAQPGQNVNAAQQADFNTLLQQKTNLAGNLAGQSQQFANTGAQGVASTAQNLDTQQTSQIMDALQSAFGLNTATLGNLNTASTAGQGVNQQQLGNIGTSATSSQNIIDQVMNFLNQGRSTLVPGVAAGNNLAANEGTIASNAGSNASSLAGNAITSFLNANNSNANNLSQYNDPSYDYVA